MTFTTSTIRAPNLGDGSVDDLVSDAVENAFLWNELDYLPNFLSNL